MTIEGPALKRHIVQAAREAGNAKRVDGKCSNCGQEIPEGNFCDQCGFTFLSEEAMAALAAEIQVAEAGPAS